MRFLILLSVVGCASAQQASRSADRVALTQEFMRTRDAFVEAIRDVTPAQATARPAGDRWSIAEIAEHIAVTEAALFKRVTHEIVATPTAPSLLSRVQPDDARISRQGADRTQKRQAPEAIRPTGRFPSITDTQNAFLDQRNQVLDYVRDTRVDLRAHAAQHAALGVMDAQQWLLFMAAHCARHTAQILEVKGASQP